MAKGFFSPSKIKQENPNDLRGPKCGICGLYQTCHSPKMPPTGRGRKKVLIVAEAPGKQEDRQGVQLIGDAGQRLRKNLKQIGIDLDRDCWKTNAVICRPPHNNTPDSEKIVACRPNLWETVETLQPKVVLLLGGVALRCAVGKLWKEGVGNLSRWVGDQIPGHRLNAWLCPTWHPSFLIRTDDKVLDLLFRQHLKRAFKKVDKPLPKPIDLKRSVRTEFNTHTAARLIRRMRQEGVPLAFDYETNCLKPEFPGARILCCSISNGRTSVAFPWHGEAIGEMQTTLSSGIPMIAANTKFEERWGKIHAQTPVKNWLCCTMIGAHVLDNREGRTSLKFQAFVTMGVGSYDDHVGPFMEAGKNGLNKLDQLDLKDLLFYNGADSLLTWKLAMIQRRKMGYEV